MRTTRSHRRRKRDRIDEYDLGARFKRWLGEVQGRVVAFVWLHPRLIAFSFAAIAALGTTSWVIAHHRPAEPPPPSAWRMRQMMKAVEEADQRVRAKYAAGVTQDSEIRGVFETMRDMPVPLTESADSEDDRAELKVSGVER